MNCVLQCKTLANNQFNPKISTVCDITYFNKFYEGPIQGTIQTDVFAFVYITLDLTCEL